MLLSSDTSRGREERNFLLFWHVMTGAELRKRGRDCKGHAIKAGQASAQGQNRIELIVKLSVDGLSTICWREAVCM